MSIAGGFMSAISALCLEPSVSIPKKIATVISLLGFRPEVPRVVSNNNQKIIHEYRYR
ncbi:MAG TPA: hypothetical protein VFH09_03425 [Nitrososphaera sp.]|nr:hypothetical protein [Nitrososphaera sp.]